MVHLEKGLTITCAVILVWDILQHGSCQTYGNVKTLYNDLFTNYKKEIIPCDPTVPLKVEISFLLGSINYFKEVDETISITGSYILKWTDISLTWNPALYGNLNRISIKSSDMWIPPLALVNRVDESKPIGDDVSFQASVFI